MNSELRQKSSAHREELRELLNFNPTTTGTTGILHPVPNIQRFPFKRNTFATASSNAVLALKQRSLYWFNKKTPPDSQSKSIFTPIVDSNHLSTEINTAPTLSPESNSVKASSPGGRLRRGLSATMRRFSESFDVGDAQSRLSTLLIPVDSPQPQDGNNPTLVSSNIHNSSPPANNSILTTSTSTSPLPQTFLKKKSNLKNVQNITTSTNENILSSVVDQSNMRSNNSPSRTKPKSVHFEASDVTGFQNHENNNNLKMIIMTKNESNMNNESKKIEDTKQR